MAIDVTQKRVNTLELDTHLCDSGAENQPFSDDSEVIAVRAQSTVTHHKKKGYLTELLLCVLTIYLALSNNYSCNAKLYMILAEKTSASS